MSSQQLKSVLLSATAMTLFGLGHAQAQAPAASAAQTPPAAQAEQASTIGEVIVTAQKRSETAQNVPITISAFNNNALAAAGITSPGDLQRIAPTFHFTSAIGTLAARLSIRGIGTFSNSAIEPSVATFIDGIYIPRPAAIINSLLDIKQVEVLSGPQGTLFGRNASVGALSFTTGTPTGVYSNDIKADYSSGDHYRLEDVINVPITDKVSVRFAGLADLFGGYWTNDLTNQKFGGLDTYQGRLSVKSQLTDNLTWTVRGDYQKNNGDGLLNSKVIPSTLTATTLANYTAKNGGITPNLNEFSSHNNFVIANDYIHDSIWGVSSDLSYQAAHGYTFRLLDGYYNWDSNQGDGDTAYLSAYTLGRNLYYRSRSNSHELQVISPTDLLGGKLNYVGGLYYFHEDLFIVADSLNGPNYCNVFSPLTVPTATCVQYNLPSSGPSSEGAFAQKTDSEAVYTQATYKVVPTVDLTGGVRYTNEQKSAVYNGVQYNPTGAALAANEHTNLSLSSSRVTYRGNVAWHPMDRVMLFGTVSTGFKSGGFNNGIATAVLGQNRIFQPETTTNYEVGVKSQFFDRTLLLNATAFRMDINNFQERSIINTTSNISNVGQVQSQGVEFQAEERPINHLKLTTSVTYLDSHIVSYCSAPLPPYLPAAASTLPRCAGQPTNTQNLAGAPLTYAPKWAGVAGGEVDGRFEKIDMRWVLNSSVNFYSSQEMSNVIDGSPITVQGGYALLDARFTLYGPQDKWSIGLYGRNLTDKGYCASMGYQTVDSLLGVRTTAPYGTLVRCQLGAPRVVGVSATAHF